MIVRHAALVKLEPLEKLLLASELVSKQRDQRLARALSGEETPRDTLRSAKCDRRAVAPTAARADGENDAES